MNKLQGAWERRTHSRACRCSCRCAHARAHACTTSARATAHQHDKACAAPHTHIHTHPHKRAAPGLTLKRWKTGSASIAGSTSSRTLTNRMFSSHVRRAVPSPYVSAMRANSCAARVQRVASGKSARWARLGGGFVASVRPSVGVRECTVDR